MFVPQSIVERERQYEILERVLGTVKTDKRTEHCEIKTEEPLALILGLFYLCLPCLPLLLASRASFLCPVVFCSVSAVLSAAGAPPAAGVVHGAELPCAPSVSAIGGGVG